MLKLDSETFQEIRRDFNEWLPAIIDGADKFVPAHAANVGGADVRDVVVAVARKAACKPQDITGPRQSATYTRPRFIAYLLASELVPKASLPQIGRAFGGRDHTTIMHGIKAAKHLVAENDAWRTLYEEVKGEF